MRERDRPRTDRKIELMREEVKREKDSKREKDLKRERCKERERGDIFAITWIHIFCSSLASEKGGAVKTQSTTCNATPKSRLVHTHVRTHAHMHEHM